MRDRLVHHYFDINLDILWQTVTEDLPQLLAALPSEDEADRRQTCMVAISNATWEFALPGCSASPLRCSSGRRPTGP